MTTSKIAILGAGSLRCCPPVLATLAQMTFEGDSDVFLWDADEERLDLFDRLGRRCFGAAKSKCRLLASSELSEALDSATVVLFQVGVHCARKFLGDPSLPPDAAVAEALTQIAPQVPDDCAVGSFILHHRHLPLADAHHFTWPAPVEESERAEKLFDVLRWVNEEDSLYPLLKANAVTPLSDWLSS